MASRAPTLLPHTLSPYNAYTPAALTRKNVYPGSNLQPPCARTTPGPIYCRRYLVISTQARKKHVRRLRRQTLGGEANAINFTIGGRFFPQGFHL